jgi:hypothetical protein
LLALPFALPLALPFAKELCKGMAEINATLTKVDADLIIRALDTKSGGSTLDSGLKSKTGRNRR